MAGSSHSHQVMLARHQTYGYLPSCQASPPIGWYQIILLGARGTRVNNLPSVALDSGAAGIQTHDLLIASSALYRYATPISVAEAQSAMARLTQDVLQTGC